MKSESIDKVNQAGLELQELKKGGKRAVVGETRMFGGREYIKTQSGWKFHGKGTGAKAKEHKASAKEHSDRGGAPANVSTEEAKRTIAENNAKHQSQSDLDRKIEEARKQSPEAKDEKKSNDKPKQETPKVGEKVHISDMTTAQKLETAKRLGIKDPENLSAKELDKQMIDKNVEKSVKEFKQKKAAGGKVKKEGSDNKSQDTSNKEGNEKDFSAENKKELSNISVSGNRSIDTSGYSEQFEKTMVSDISETLQKKFKDKKISDVSIHLGASQGGSFGVINDGNNNMIVRFSLDDKSYRIDTSVGEKYGNSTTYVSQGDVGIVEGGQYKHIDSVDLTGKYEEDDNSSYQQQKKLITKHGLYKDGYHHGSWNREKYDASDFKGNPGANRHLLSATLFSELVNKIKD